ncbi:MAG: MGMT family protein [Bradymonadia bacterium]
MSTSSTLSSPRILGPGFNQMVYALVRTVPPGRVTTYGDVATALGSVRVARQVGYAMAASLASDEVPWQRVINREGRISGRGDTLRALEQEALLEAEGIHLDDKGRVDLKTLRWAFTAEAIDHAWQVRRGAESDSEEEEG